MPRECCTCFRILLGISRSRIGVSPGDTSRDGGYSLYPASIVYRESSGLFRGERRAPLNTMVPSAEMKYISVGSWNQRLLETDFKRTARRYNQVATVNNIEICSLEA